MPLGVPPQPNRTTETVIIKSDFLKVKYFEAIVKGQSADGSWAATGQWASYGGPVYISSVYLAMLQLDKGTLPIYMR